MGHAGSAHLSAVPQRSGRRNRATLLHGHVKMAGPSPNFQIHLSFTDFRRQWPQPVLLKQIEEGPLQVRVWNPKVRLLRLGRCLADAEL